ncbi:MAG TPA: response regulator [Candidatus Kapabacteria bacterium]|nr:response regulator [Candidatus Kapabacteria bacterium]
MPKLETASVQEHVKAIPANGKKSTILLVDDHDDTSAAVKMLLERQGYSVRVSASSAQAIDTIKNEPVDLIISDIGLPDESGLMMLKKIRKISDVPAIALSGFGSDDDIQRSHEAGFQKHLTKPFNLQKFRDTIAHLLGNEKR